MAIHAIEKIYEGAPPTRRTVNGLMEFRGTVSGNITAVYFWIGNVVLSSPDAIFNIRQNSTSLWTGAARPSITVGAIAASKTGLAIATVRGDRFQLDLESVPSAGGVAGPVTVIMLVDDGVKEALSFALSDETTDITTGTKLTARMPFAFNITDIRVNLNTASSSGLVGIDIKESGTSIFSTKPTIDATEKTSTTAATAAVISDTSLADDAEITFIVDTAGTGAKGLKVTIIGHPA